MNETTIEMNETATTINYETTKQMKKLYLDNRELTDDEEGTQWELNLIITDFEGEDWVGIRQRTDRDIIDVFHVATESDLLRFPREMVEPCVDPGEVCHYPPLIEW